MRICTTDFRGHTPKEVDDNLCSHVVMCQNLYTMFTITTVVSKHMSMNRGEIVSGDETEGIMDKATIDECAEIFRYAVTNRKSVKKFFNNIC